MFSITCDRLKFGNGIFATFRPSLMRHLITNLS